MAIKRIYELTNTTSLNSLDKLPVDRSGSTARSILATDFATAVRPYASTLEAQTGTATDRSMTPANATSHFEARTTAYTRTILDDADAATARATLGANDASNLSTGTLPIARVADGAVTSAKLASMAEGTVKGRAYGGGAGVPSDLSLAQPVFASRAAAAAATIPAAVKTLRTEFFAPTYATPATLVGGAVYRRASFATLTGYPSASYLRSTDRFMPDGTTDSTNGGYWLLMPFLGCIDIEQCGALGDGSTNDYAAINAAFEYAALSSTQVTVIFFGKTYRHATPLTINSGQAAVTDAANVNFDGIPRINIVGVGDATLLATAAMDQQIYLTDAGGGTPATNWMKIEGVKFDGASVAVRNIRTFFCSNVEVTRCKFVRATYGYWNEGFGIATITRNVFYNQFGIYNIKGGDNWYTYNDFYPLANGAGIVKGASTGNDRILFNVFTVDTAQYPADGVQLLGNLTDGVTVGVDGICTIRNGNIHGNEFNGVRYGVAAFGMTAAQKATWLAGRPTDAWPFNDGETIWDVRCDNNHGFAAPDAAKPIILYYFSDVRGIVATNSTLSSTTDAALPGSSMIQTVRCKDVRAIGHTCNYVSTPAYFFETDGATYTGNAHRRCGDGSTNNALVVFDNSKGIHRMNTYDRFDASGSNVGYASINGGSLNKGDNIDLNGTHAMSVLN